MMPKEADPKLKKVLNAFPVRNPVKWRLENGRAVVIYSKNLTAVEKRMSAWLGGSEHVRRPMDEVGTEIWTMCDGHHSILDICKKMDERHHEKVEPVVKNVVGFLEILLKLNLVSLKKGTTKKA